MNSRKEETALTGKEDFVKGAPEVYFNKPELRRQRVSPRHRPSGTNKCLSGRNLTTMGKRNIFGRIFGWFGTWFPDPVGGR